METSIRDNICMPIMKRISKCLVLNTAKTAEIAEKYRESLSTKTPTIEQAVKNLSGGNQQKVILGKWMAAESDLFLMNRPEELT